jgi:hypothetical protein
VPALAQTGTTKPAGTKKQQRAGPSPGPVLYGSERLPAPVQDMREAILAAARSGDIADLRHALELIELKPEVADRPVADPIAFWKEVSADGEGREVLAILADLLDAGYVVLPLGRDPENPGLYVWPYFAELPLGRLTPAQQVELMRLVPPQAAKEMQRTGRYTHWRLVIGADGVWHSFRKQP